MARLAGAVYLLIIVLGLFGEMFVRARIVDADPVKTAANLKAMESLWRLGIVTEYVSLICVAVLAMLYLFLLLPVSRELNVLATILRLIAIVVQVVAVMNLAAPLSPATNPTLTTLAVRAHGHGFAISLLFTGCTFLVHGYLIYRSGFLPKILGILIQLAGVAYIVNTLALILAPAVGHRLFPWILLPPFIGELSLSLWLLIKGVDETKWNAMRDGAYAVPRR